MIIKFNSLPIRTKVLQIIVGGMLLTVLLSLVIFISYDYHVSKHTLVKDIAMEAKFAASNLVNEMPPEPTQNAPVVITQIASLSSTLAVCVYSANNTLLIAKVKDGAPFKCANKWSDINDTKTLSTVHTLQLLHKNNQVAGALLVVSDLRPLQIKLRNWLKLSGLVVVFSFIIAYIMTWRMHKAIVEPALKIKTAMDTVRKNNDLSLRAPEGNKDELGQLALAFNELLQQMEADASNLSNMYRELVNKSTEAEANAIELEARSEYFKQMMSNAAHDLRQPLQAMSIFIEALQMFELPEEPASVVNKLNSAQNNLSQMFNDIISVSKLNEQDFREEYKAIHLGELFEKLHLEFEAIATNKNIDLKTYIPNFSVTSSPSTLERIIRNLVSNAIRYTDKGGVLLGVRKRKNEVIIEVWDTGCGIPDKDQKSIFNRYGQVAKNKNDPFGGYGLGLAIVSHFAKTIGCRVTVRSKVGQGSCFKIHIPYVEAQAELEAINTPELPQKGSPTKQQQQALKPEQDLSGLFIYVVDDEQSLREALTLLFSKLNVKTKTFSSVNALKRYLLTAECEQPDFILSDYQLGHNQIGAQAIQLVRKRFKQEVPGIIMTGNPSKAVHQKILDHGFGLALKPLSRATLQELLGGVERRA